MFADEKCSVVSSELNGGSGLSSFLLGFPTLRRVLCSREQGFGEGRGEGVSAPACGAMTDGECSPLCERGCEPSYTELR